MNTKPPTQRKAETSVSYISRIVKALEADVHSLTATSLEDAAVLHTEALLMGEDWEFLGVFPSIRQGVIEAINRGGRRFQMNYIPFVMEELPAGFYIYFTRKDSYGSEGA